MDNDQGLRDLDVPSESAAAPVSEPGLRQVTHPFSRRTCLAG